MLTCKAVGLITSAVNTVLLLSPSSPLPCSAETRFENTMQCTGGTSDGCSNWEPTRVYFLARERCLYGFLQTPMSGVT